MTNPYLTAPHDRLVADDETVATIRARIVEAMNIVKKTIAQDRVIVDASFLRNTHSHLEAALQTLEATETMIQKVYNNENARQKNAANDA